MTQAVSPAPDRKNSSRPRAGASGWAATLCSAAAAVVFCLDDPWLLSLPLALAGIALGLVSMRRRGQHAPGLIGLNLGLLMLLLWLIVQGLLKLLLGADINLTPTLPTIR